MVQPSDYSGSRYTDGYRVQITGLQDAATGSEAQISYTTRFADITEEMPSYVTSVTADAREYVIYKTMDNIESIKKLQQFCRNRYGQQQNPERRSEYL